MEIKEIDGTVFVKDYTKRNDLGLILALAVGSVLIIGFFVLRLI